MVCLTECPKYWVWSRDPQHWHQDQYHSLVYWESGCRAGGEQQASEWGFMCIYSCSPLLSHHPEMEQSCFRKTSSGLPLILHYDDLYNYFITYHNVVIKEIKCTINEISFNHPKIISLPIFVEKLSSKKPAPFDKRWGIVGLEDCFSVPLSVFFPGDW